MPELPEVETVKRYLEKCLIGKTLDAPVIYWKKIVQSDLQDYSDSLKGHKIIALDRKGKFLIFRLDDSSYLLFHLRMEGKLFLVDKENHSLSHLSLFLPFENDKEGLAFYDTRKFGVTYHLKEGEESPLDKLGKEPFEMNDGNELLSKIRKSRLPIKELLMDQSIIAGIGNIYASEILFDCGISPFRCGDSITEEEANRILSSSKKILSEAIEKNGSTVHSYLLAPETQGSYQDNLMVYQRKGMECRRCHLSRIESHKINQRSTFYCPHCQHTGISIGITGKIGSGKSLVTSYFKEAGYRTFSCDECVHSLYNDKSFLINLKSEFPMIFNKNLSKKKLSNLLLKDSSFKKKYETYLYRIVREKTMEFLMENDGYDKAIEVPLLFDAHMESMFTYLLGTETHLQKEHLEERGDKNIEKRISFNTINSYDKNKDKLNFVLTTDGTKEELKEKVNALVRKLKENVL